MMADVPAPCSAPPRRTQATCFPWAPPPLAATPPITVPITIPLRTFFHFGPCTVGAIARPVRIPPTPPTPANIVTTPIGQRMPKSGSLFAQMWWITTPPSAAPSTVPLIIPRLITLARSDTTADRAALARNELAAYGLPTPTTEREDGVIVCTCASDRIGQN